MTTPDPLDTLKQKIEASKSGSKEQSGSNAPPSGIGPAMRLTLELVAGVGMGALLGYALDQWLGTKPWLLILCFFLGTAAGFRNMLREAKKITEKEG